LHGITARKDRVRKMAGELLLSCRGGRKIGKKKKKFAEADTLVVVDVEQDNIDKMISFTARVSKNSDVRKFENLQLEGKYEESEKYEMSAHAICLVFDDEGHGWIGNPANFSWKALTFENYVENLVWTYAAYEFNLTCN